MRQYVPGPTRRIVPDPTGRDAPTPETLISQLYDRIEELEEILEELDYRPDY